MKKLFIVFLLLLILGAGYLLIINTPSYDSAFKPIPTPGPSLTPLVLDSMKIYNLINDYRISKGLNKLVFDPSMCDYTKKRLTEIHSDFSHAGFIQVRPPYFFSPNVSIGENLSRGSTSDQETVDTWIKSPTHLENIVKPVYTRTCISTDNNVNETYVVQEFASY